MRNFNSRRGIASHFATFKSVWPKLPLKRSFSDINAHKTRCLTLQFTGVSIVLIGLVSVGLVGYRQWDR